MTTELTTLIIGQVVIVLGGVSKIIYDILATKKAKQDREQDRLDREQDRLDREQLAKLTASQLEEVKSAGNTRMQTIVQEVQAVKAVGMEGIRINKEAIDAANSHNEKIAAVTDAIKSIAPLVQKVEVVNPNPIQVEMTPS